MDLQKAQVFCVVKVRLGYMMGSLIQVDVCWVVTLCSVSEDLAASILWVNGMFADSAWNIYLTNQQTNKLAS
jgi:hypothetical protein